MRHTAAAPVRNERPAVVVEEHVARLQVAVNDAKTMQVHKPLATHRKHTQCHPTALPTSLTAHATRGRTRNMSCSTRHASVTFRWGARLSSHAFKSPPLHHGIWMYLSVLRQRVRGCVRAFVRESDVTRTNRYHPRQRTHGWHPKIRLAQA